jgi:hypothetical protein
MILLSLQLKKTQGLQGSLNINYKSKCIKVN